MLHVLSTLLKFLSLSTSARASGGKGNRPRRRLAWEGLELRTLQATLGYDYILNGYKWSNPGHITYSIAPDGVFWDHGTNNLNATMNAKFGGTWQREIARALATWESVANINISQVGDSPLDLDAPGLSQGDSRFGDIRFGGYAFPNNTTTLAQSYYPPPDYGTGSGDVEVNTTMPWSIGKDYDFYSVMLHETGLTLGLGEPPNPSVVMATIYGGVRSGLDAGDIAGIQAIYGARTQDAYQSKGQGLGLSSAIDVTGSLNASGQATLSNVSLATIGGTEYFTFVAPQGAHGALTVSAIAGGVSMLSPKITLLDASGNVISSGSDASKWSNNVSANELSVSPGERFYVAVTGATNDVFSVGGYQLQVSFAGLSTGGSSQPTTPSTPTTPTTPSTPTTPYYPLAPVTGLFGPPAASTTPASLPAPTTSNLGVVATSTTVTGQSVDPKSGPDRYVFVAMRAGIYQVVSPGTTIQILDSFGRTVGGGSGFSLFRAPRARGLFTVVVNSSDSNPVDDYNLTISSMARRVGQRQLSVSPMNHARSMIHRASVGHRFH